MVFDQLSMSRMRANSHLILLVLATHKLLVTQSLDCFVFPPFFRSPPSLPSSSDIMNFYLLSLRFVSLDNLVGDYKKIKLYVSHGVCMCFTTISYEDVIRDGNAAAICTHNVRYVYLFRKMKNVRWALAVKIRTTDRKWSVYR